MIFLNILIFLPFFCNGGFLDNQTNMISYSYNKENCSLKPYNIYVSQTFSCYPFKSLSICCKNYMDINNITKPINICHNNYGNSSFTTCYQQQISPFESNTIGILSIIGILFIVTFLGSLIYLFFYRCSLKHLKYHTLN